MEHDDDSLDRDLIGLYLAERIAGFGTLGEIKRFRQGQSNPTYLLEAEGGRYVLRTQPPGKLLPSAHQVAREYRVMQALASTPVPVPRVHLLALAEDDSPLQRDFFVMDFVEGEIYWDPALPTLDDATRGAIYDQQNLVLAQLHSVAVGAVGLGDFGKPGNYYARQIARWRKQYEASVLEPIPTMDWLMAWLDEHQPEDDGKVALVHGDYRLDNMIIQPKRPPQDTRIIAVLDWELSTLGHPYADLAYQCMQWRLPNTAATRGLLGLAREKLGIPSEDDYVNTYCERRGEAPIDHWPFYLAFSFFRLAAIVQGVVKRAADGNASNPEQVEQYRAMVPALSTMAKDIVRRGN
ncbi:MAG: phosphotransferase family protein [Pseudomonadota bacterium]